jgi:alpha-glucosidase
VAEQHFGRPADERAFIVVPLTAPGVARGGCVEDDGESEAWRSGAQGRWNVSIETTEQSLLVSVTREGRMPDAQSQVKVLIPAGDMRPVACAGGELMGDETSAGWRNLTVRVI